MPRIKRDYSPFGGIDTAVSKTDKGQGTLTDAQGVYHKEIGRLHPCNESVALVDNANYDGTVLPAVNLTSHYTHAGRNSQWLGFTTVTPVPVTDIYASDTRVGASMTASHALYNRNIEVPSTAASLKPADFYTYYGEQLAFGTRADVYTSQNLAFLFANGHMLRGVLGSWKSTIGGTVGAYTLPPFAGEEQAALNAYFYIDMMFKLGYRIPVTIHSSTASEQALIKLYEYGTGAVEFADEVGDALDRLGGIGTNVIVQIQPPTPAQAFQLANDWILAYQDAIPARAYKMTTEMTTGWPSIDPSLSGRYIQGLISSPIRGLYLLGRDIISSAATISRTAANTLTPSTGTTYASTLVTLYNKPSSRSVADLIPYSFYADGNGGTLTTDLSLPTNIVGVRCQSGRIGQARRFRSVEMHNRQLVGVEGHLYETIDGSGTITLATATITGAGTAFTTEVKVGDWIAVRRGTGYTSSSTIDENLRSLTIVGKVSSIASATSIVLTTPTAGTVTAATYQILRPLTKKKRNRIWVGGTPADAANGIPEDVSNWADWATPSFEIGDFQDGNITRVLSVDDTRLLVFFERAVYEITGTLPLGDVIPADFNINKISGSAGAFNHECVDFDRVSQTVYFVGERGAFRMVGSAIEPIDTRVKDHPQWKESPDYGNYNWTNLKFADDRVYLLGSRYTFDSRAHVIWIYDTRNEEWTYTKRITQLDGGNDFAISPYGAGGIAVDETQRKLLLFHRDNEDIAGFQELHTTILNDEDNSTDSEFYHVGKVQFALTDLDTTGQKRIISMKAYTSVPRSGRETVPFAVIGEGVASNTRDITPDRSGNNSAVYVSGGQLGSGGTAVGIQVGDGESPLPELRGIWADVQLMGGGGRG